MLHSGLFVPRVLLTASVSAPSSSTDHAPIVSLSCFYHAFTTDAWINRLLRLPVQPAAGSECRLVLWNIFSSVVTNGLTWQLQRSTKAHGFLFLGPHCSLISSVISGCPMPAFREAWADPRGAYRLSCCTLTDQLSTRGI